MKFSLKSRIAISVLLTVIGAAALYGLFRYGAGLIYSPLSTYSLLALVGLVGSGAILVFVTTIAEHLQKNKSLCKEAYYLSLLFCFFGLVILALFGYGLLKDVLGVHCSGFFGSQWSCMMPPLLGVVLVGLNPLTLGLLGSASVYGLVKQRFTNKKR